MEFQGKNVKMVSEEDRAEAVKDLIVLAEEFSKELKTCFVNHSATGCPYKFQCKHICIEIYEFTCYLDRIIGLIGAIVKRLNSSYSAAGHTPFLQPIETHHRKTVQKWKKELILPRNRIAAHRYTDRSGSFLSVSEVSQLWNQLRWDNLLDAQQALTEVHQAIVTWYQNPINKNNLILAKSKKLWE